jgi:hypothetical protein
VLDTAADLANCNGVDEFTPEQEYAVATEEPGGATRWTF